MNTLDSGTPKDNTSLRTLKVLAFLLLLAFYASILVNKIELPIGDDMARHIKNGELILSGNFAVTHTNFYSYTEPDHGFIHHNWLANAIFYLLHQAVGWGGLVVFKVLILLSAFALLFFTALKKADFWLVALLSIPTIIILGERSDLRPEIFSFLLVATFLYFLTDLEEYPERKRIFWLIPLQLIWVNLHLFFIIGIMLVGGFLFEKIITHRKNLKSNPLIKKLVVLLLAIIAVSFVNPNGWVGALQPLRIFSNYGITVSENQSLQEYLKTSPLGEDASIVVFIPAVAFLVASFLLGFRKIPIFYFLATVGTGAAGFFIMRMISYLGFIFLPATAMNLNGFFGGVQDRLRQFLPGQARTLGKILIIFFIGILLACITLGVKREIFSDKKPGIGLAPHVEDGAVFFLEHNLKGPIFNDYDIGSYLIYYLFPKEKVFVDNRPEAYPASFFEDTYQLMLQDENRWQEMLARYDFNTIFFHLNDQALYIRPFLYRRTEDPAWSLVFVDQYSIIFIRNTPENQGIIRRFHITPGNAGETLAHLINSSDFDGRVAAADMFTLLGRHDLAEVMFVDIVSRWPDRGKIWAAMGAEWQLVNNSKERSLLATMFLEKAIALGWKTGGAYTFLGSGYIDIGQPERAKKALQKALRVDPDRQDAKRLLEQLN